MLADELCRRIEGARYFQWLLTKFTTPEEVFGAVSLRALEQDEYRRVTTRKLPEAHVAFLDEVFKASSSILNALLTLLNERRFHNGREIVAVPLLTLFGAANELPEEDELAAIYDRFLVRFVVGYVVEDLALPAHARRPRRRRPRDHAFASRRSRLQRRPPSVAVPDGRSAPHRRCAARARPQQIVAVGPTLPAERWRCCARCALLRGKSAVTDDEVAVPRARPVARSGRARDGARRAAPAGARLRRGRCRSWSSRAASSASTRTAPGIPRAARARRIEVETKLRHILQRVDSIVDSARQGGRSLGRALEIRDEIVAIEQETLRSL